MQASNLCMHLFVADENKKSPILKLHANETLFVANMHYAGRKKYSIPVVGCSYYYKWAFLRCELA